MKLLLAGAGGHAKAICEALRASALSLAGYVDPAPADWLDELRYASDREALDSIDNGGVVIGVGGTTRDQLRARLALLDLYLEASVAAPPVTHPSATVSNTAQLSDGAIVLAGAVIQPYVRLDRGALVNTGAIVEHDCEIGPGAHIAPGAIVLGDCRIGACAMIGAGAVVLPGADIPADTIVKSLTRSAGGGQ